jgi:hypothetical protein
MQHRAIAVPLALRCAATSAVHPANAKAIYRRRTAGQTGLDLARHLGAALQRCMGLSLISFSQPSPPYRIRQPCLVEDRHRHHRTGSQEIGRNDIANPTAGGEAIGDNRLIRRDVVRGDMLDGERTEQSPSSMANRKHMLVPSSSQCDPTRPCPVGQISGL